MRAGAPPEGDHARYLATRSFGSLDGLRAVSILAVIWHHTPSVYPELPLSRRGFLGVDLFFIISGFLIVTLLLRERGRTGAISLRGFYARRFLRIFPPFYLMLAIVAATAFVRSTSASRDIARDLPFAAAYVSNWFPMHSLLSITWSLSVEEQFYLIIPAVIRHVRRAVPGLLAAAYVVLNLPAFSHQPGAASTPAFRATFFAPILLGVLLAFALDGARGYRLISRLAGHRLTPLACAVLLLLACSPPGDIAGWPRILIHWAMVALVASCVVQERHVLAPALAFGPVRRIGAVSYGMYLYHLLVRHWVNGAARHLGVSSDLGMFLATALGAWAVAEVSYRLYETRFLALKERFAAPARATAPALTDAPAAPPT